MYKKRFNLRNVAAIVAYLAVTAIFSGCDKDPNGNEDEFSVSADVYISTDVVRTDFAPYIPWGGDLKISVGDYERYSIGRGEIKKGKLTFTLGTPKNPQKMNEAYYHWDLYEKWGAEYVNFTYSDPDAKTDYLQLGGKELGKPGFIYKMNYYEAYPEAAHIDVFFVYVDRDVTVSATGINYYYPIYDGKYYSQTTNNDINLPLRKGWNEVYRKYVFSTEGGNEIGILSFGMGSYGCNWIVQ